MKISCKVNQKPALVVGYVAGRKGKPLAVVICEGKLRSVKLKDIDLGELASELRAKDSVVPLRTKVKSDAS